MLKLRIELFRESARVFRPSDELSELTHFLGDIQLKVARTVGGLPGHQGYVEQLCTPYRNATAAQLAAVPKRA